MSTFSFGPSDVVTKVEYLAPRREGGRAMLAPRIPRGLPRGTFIITIFSFCVFLFFSNAVQAPTLVEVSVGSTKINVEIARTSEELLRGLSGRESLEGGMWFVFPKDDYHGMWMKEMFFPLDIIWVDSDFAIVYMEENISPNTFPEVFKPTTKARYVLEVPAGFALQYGVKIGNSVMFLKK